MPEDPTGADHVSGRDERQKPPPEAVQAALEAMAEELMRLHPEWEVRVHRPGEPLPPGAVTLPAASRDDVDAIRGHPARKRG
jgi:hypothetical protein